MFFNWDISDAADIRAHHFDIINIIKPMPSSLFLSGYIVIGTGPTFKPLEDGAITKLKSFGIKFDVLDTVLPDY
jgi:NADH dehydrogenase [ubiquinone] 1 alpha subcomplex assembly factor 3